MITSPKGRGWTVITCTRQGDDEVSDAMAGYTNTRDHTDAQWSSLRRKVQANRRLPKVF